MQYRCKKNAEFIADSESAEKVANMFLHKKCIIIKE